MPRQQIGLHAQEMTPRETLAAIVRAEQAGIPAAWLTTGGVGMDGMALLAAAAVQTRTIQLGTSIVPTYPRHPLALVQQTLVLADLAPDRFVLGVGPSHRPGIEGVFGIPFGDVPSHLREYLTVLRQALHLGRFDFDGAQYRVHGQVPNPPKVPILLSALRTGSYRLAGELADGAISWITPAAYLRDHALPALREGATRRRDGRTPRLVAHCFAAVDEDAAAVVAVARERLGFYLRLPFYQKMAVAAGHPEGAEGKASDAFVAAVVAHGDEEATARGIRSFLDAGADEVIVSPLPVGPDPRASKDRTVALLGKIARA
ncbi:MAG: LLM class flavin-dependent oxidoreductase [Chloroflexi bacterium]|nr:LLM class flavin-dependent oxidoreductase [Chloroflexota bacterium]